LTWFNTIARFLTGFSRFHSPLNLLVPADIDVAVLQSSLPSLFGSKIKLLKPSLGILFSLGIFGTEILQTGFMRS
jgi:hypothetical protein